MTRVLGRFVSLEMAVLGLCELTLSFLVIYAMLAAPGAVPVLASATRFDGSPSISPDCAILAAVLAVTIVVTAAAIGLYRPEICIERRRLLINTSVAGMLAFPAVLMVSGSFNIGLSRYTVLWLTKVLFVWLICIVASRLIFNRVMRERWFVRRILVIGSVPRALHASAVGHRRSRAPVRADIFAIGQRGGPIGHVAVAGGPASPAHLGHRVVGEPSAARYRGATDAEPAGLQAARRARIRRGRVLRTASGPHRSGEYCQPTGCSTPMASPTGGFPECDQARH